MGDSIISKSRIKSLSMIILSNGITMISGIMAGLLLPKIMSVIDYGFYKIYNLYFGYLPLLHFGLSTGIYLTYGDKYYNELNRDHFRCYFRLLFVSQAFFGTILIVISRNVINEDYAYIIACLAFVLIANNVINYFQLISQITERYKEYSIRNIIQSVLNVVLIAVLYYCHQIRGREITYKNYLFYLVCIQIGLSCWYVWTYRDIVFGKVRNKPTKNDLLNLYKNGFVLIVSGLVAQLILNIDRQFVSILYTTEEFAVYAFAYSLLTLMTTFINAASTVLYPSIKRITAENLEAIYERLIRLISIVTALLISFVYLLDIIIRSFLPKYIDSLRFLYIIIPTMIISCLINVIVHNYFKAMNIEKLFFLISVFVLIQSAIANYAVYVLFGTMVSISIASVICMICWYIYTQVYLYKKFKFRYKKNAFYIFLILSFFYAISFAIKNSLISFFLFLLFWGIITSLLYRKDVIKTYNDLFSKTHN